MFGCATSLGHATYVEKSCFKVFLGTDFGVVFSCTISALSSAVIAAIKSMSVMDFDLSIEV